MSTHCVSDAGCLINEQLERYELARETILSALQLDPLR